ncbi:MAG: PhzF family phenazine biosynthesis protein [Betaproteobacteria bacterium]|nr:PhzF family phenazine biosynthesis protein [Betaproteobacteria bacterium]
MREFRFRLVNVFAESPLGGNPLCVFEDGRGLSDAEMQALALQMNLSETTFILPSEQGGTAKVRIFTPTFEMPFAGHPTFGTAHVARDLFKGGDQVTLELRVGPIPVTAKADRWTLTANAPTSRDGAPEAGELAAVLGLGAADVVPGARWINTGTEQLIVPLASTDAVRRANPTGELLGKIASSIGRSMAYVFAPNGDGKLLSRFFFMKHGSVIEDPGTGSATANLGGWLLHTRHALPVAFAIDQGEAVGRPCRVSLRVDAERNISVGGQVIEIGSGVIRLP